MSKQLSLGLACGGLGAVLCVAGLVVWKRAPERTPAPPEGLRDAALAAGGSVAPLPAVRGLDPRRVELGRKLFHDGRLSRDGTIACASCHDLDNGGDDGRRVSIGIGGAEGDVNAPTVLNARFNFRQYWDGRVETLEDQVDGPIEHPKEMAAGWELVLERLRGDAAYAAEFASAYADGVTKRNVKDALCEFERSLVTHGSRFDRFLEGEEGALSADERAGWALFQEIGCITCHQGVNLGGNSFQAFGVMGNYFADRGEKRPADDGRFNVTKKERDRHRFKVPTLRNVELTAPYFHHGEIETLDEAVKVMARYQLGYDLEPEEVRRIVAFLKTLTGTLPPR